MCDQLEGSEADWPDALARVSFACQPGNQMTTVSSQWLAVTSKRRANRMFRRIVIRLLLTVLLFTISPASAQQPTKVPRVGYLVAASPSAITARTESFRQGLRELGYVEGKNIVIEWRSAEGKLDRIPALVAELVRLKVDIIVATGGDTMIRPAKNATKTIPIVMVGGGIDPVVAGFVESLSRPGGNVTGITNLARELGGKRLELLKEAVPKVNRVAVFYEPANPNSVREVKEYLPVAARALKLTVRPWE